MIDDNMREALMEVPKDKRNEATALAFLLELELSKGKNTESENAKLFLDYAEVLEDEQ